MSEIKNNSLQDTTSNLSQETYTLALQIISLACKTIELLHHNTTRSEAEQINTNQATTTQTEDDEYSATLYNHNKEEWRRYYELYLEEQSQLDKYTLLSAGTIFSVSLASIKNILPDNSEPQYAFLFFYTLSALAVIICLSLISFAVSVSSKNSMMNKIRQNPYEDHSQMSASCKDLFIRVSNIISLCLILSAIIALLIFVILNNTSTLFAT